MSDSAADRFMKYVDILSDRSRCWNWLGSKEKNGYGLFDNEGCTTAHRFSYLLHLGVFPPDFDIGHLCDNKSCVNPNHLKAMSRSENILRMVKDGNHNQARKTHCPQGHEYTFSNTTKYVGRDGSPRRECRTCCREKMRHKRHPESYA